jgi:hypothetical protein
MSQKISGHYVWPRPCISRRVKEGQVLGVPEPQVADGVGNYARGVANPAC